jgi:hypothetical protein
VSRLHVNPIRTGSNPVLTAKLNNMKLKFSRVQEVEVELKREPTIEELKILLGKDIEASMFDLPEDLIDWDSEDVVGEDYSSNTNIYIPKPETIK